MKEVMRIKLSTTNDVNVINPSGICDGGVKTEK